MLRSLVYKQTTYVLVLLIRGMVCFLCRFNPPSEYVNYMFICFWSQIRKSEMDRLPRVESVQIFYPLVDVCRFIHTKRLNTSDVTYSAHDFGKWLICS